jgi:outer membrane protein assembly factor BamB
VEWSDTKNVRWKVEIPGRGHATPIIWGDRIYIQTALGARAADAESDNGDAEPASPGRGGPQERPARQDREGRRGGRPGRGQARPTQIHQFIVMALDRKTGKTLWSRTVREELPHEAGHADATQASNSPVTDGEHIFAFFGSRGLFCLDMEGNVKWDADFGDMQTRMGFGEGASPALHGDTVVVNWDHEGDSFIVALDKSTGKERWRQPRDEKTSWATPLILEAGGKAQVITCATNRVRSYDLKTGELVWECGGMTNNVIPTPVAEGGLVYAISGFRGSALLAIRYADAKGNLDDSPAIAWRHEGQTPYVPSPLLFDGRLYFLDNNRAIVSCLDARSGEKVYGPERIEAIRGVYASPVAAKDRIYIAGRDGKTVVLRGGPKFEILATNVLDDEFDASPAIVDDELYLRGVKHLYCIASE